MNSTQANVTLPLPPGSLGLPIFGETINLIKELNNFEKKRYLKHGKIFKTCIFSRPTIYICGAEGNRFIFTNDNDYFDNGLFPTMKKLLGNSSLSVQTGTEHRIHRRLLSQAFQPRLLTEYIPTIQKITHHYLQNWQTQKKLTWYPELQNYTFDIACKFLIGLDNASRTRIKRLFDVWVKGLFSRPPAKVRVS